MTGGPGPGVLFIPRPSSGGGHLSARGRLRSSFTQKTGHELKTHTVDLLLYPGSWNTQGDARKSSDSSPARWPSPDSPLGSFLSECYDLIQGGSILSHIMPRRVIIGFHWNSLPPTFSATRAEEFDLFFFFLREKTSARFAQEEGGSRNTGGSTPSANYEETKQKHRGLLHPHDRWEDLGRGDRGREGTDATLVLGQGTTWHGSSQTQGGEIQF